jgi:hypothetical protein
MTYTQRMLERMRDENNGSYPAFAWPGGYPIVYYVADGSTLCPDCANNHAHMDASDPQWCLVAHDINWEDDTMQCEHCNTGIDCAYGVDDE